MNELTAEQEGILAQCLQSMEEGEGLEACLARFPQHAQALRPFLHLHAELLEAEVPEPSAALYQAGREALLGRLAERPHPARPLALRSGQALAGLATAFGARARALSARSWKPMLIPLAQALGVTAIVFVAAGGALGASAGVGFEPSQHMLANLGVIEKPEQMDPYHVDDKAPKLDEARPSEEPKDTEPSDDKTPHLAVAPPQAEPTADKPDAGPTEKPAATPVPARRADEPGPKPTDAPAPTAVVEPTPIPVDLGVCIPRGAYNFYVRLQQYDVELCSADEVASLREKFAKGLCLPKEAAELYPALTAFPVRPCTPDEEAALVQYMFVKGWCVPDKVAFLLYNLGYDVPACTPHKIADVIKWYLEHDPCGLDWNSASIEPVPVTPNCPG
jgi:hypothetical protein